MRCLTLLTAMPPFRLVGLEYSYRLGSVARWGEIQSRVWPCTWTRERSGSEETQKHVLPRQTHCSGKWVKICGAFLLGAKRVKSMSEAKQSSGAPDIKSPEPDTTTRQRRVEEQFHEWVNLLFVCTCTLWPQTTPEFVLLLFALQYLLELLSLDGICISALGLGHLPPILPSSLRHSQGPPVHPSIVSSSGKQATDQTTPVRSTTHMGLILLNLPNPQHQHFNPPAVINNLISRLQNHVYLPHHLPLPICSPSCSVGCLACLILHLPQSSRGQHVSSSSQPAFLGTLPTNRVRCHRLAAQAKPWKSPLATPKQKKYVPTRAGIYELHHARLRCESAVSY